MYNTIKDCRLSTTDSNVRSELKKYFFKRNFISEKVLYFSELSDMTAYLNFCCIEFMTPEKLGGFVFPLEDEDIRLSRICADRPFEL